MAKSTFRRQFISIPIQSHTHCMTRVQALRYIFTLLKFSQSYRSRPVPPMRGERVIPPIRSRPVPPIRGERVIPPNRIL